MSLDKDSPSWLIYKSYFIKHSRGEQPRHLYDGYQEDHFTIQGSGPFSSKRALDNDTATISYADDEDDISQPSVVEKFPKGAVKMIAPTQANLDKAKSSLRQEQAQHLKDRAKTAHLPPGGVIQTPDINPHIDTAITQEPTPQLKAAEEQTLPLAGEVINIKRKRKNNLSLSDIRQKLLQSSGWKKTKKN